MILKCRTECPISRVCLFLSLANAAHRMSGELSAEAEEMALEPTGHGGCRNFQNRPRCVPGDGTACKWLSRSSARVIRLITRKHGCWFPLLQRPWRSFRRPPTHNHHEGKISPGHRCRRPASRPQGRWPRCRTCQALRTGPPLSLRGHRHPGTHSPVPRKGKDPSPRLRIVRFLAFPVFVY